jgi:hydroxypyruvate isomerase
MQRRSFLAGAAAAGLGASTLGRAQSSVSPQSALGESGSSQNKPFKLKYAPHFGMFKKHAPGGPIDELKFMHDQGFRAVEDNWMGRRKPELQTKLAKEMERLDIQMGVFVAHYSSKVTYTSNDKAMSQRLVDEMKKAVEVAKRVGAKWCTVVPGKLHQRIEPSYQTAYLIDNLRRCAEVCEPSGLTIVIEALNPWRDHPGWFLSKIPQAFEICRAVNSPSVKILDDLYHQQITEGNLIPNIDLAWSEIAYFQTGDNPGRKEPTTGEINYLNVFKHIHKKGYKGILGMEHGNSKPGKEGEMAVVKAYQASDAF